MQISMRVVYSEVGAPIWAYDCPGQHEHSGEGEIGYYALSNLGRAMLLRARILFVQGRDEEAKSEFLCAAEAFEKLGAT